MVLPVVHLLITCAICYGIIRIAVWHFRRRRLYKLAAKFGGPKVIPVIGNAHLLIGSDELRLDRLHELTNLYPSVFRLWIGPSLFFFISDPEYAKVVCLSPKTLGKFEFMDFARSLVGTGVLTAPVAKWKVHRKLIQPTFNPKILDSFVEVFVTQSNILIGLMKRNLDGPEFEVLSLISACTLDMICETAMGAKVQAQMERNSYFVQAFRGVLSGLFKRFTSLWLHPDFIFYRTNLGKTQRRSLKTVHDFTDKIIRQKRDQRAKSISRTDDESDESHPMPRRKVFLDYLMQLSHGNTGLSNEALHDEVMTMILAGSDTSAIVDSFILLMLASHPDIQEKAYQELYEIYGDDDIDEHPVIPEDLSRMKYLERVIKETLRLFPIGPFIARAVTDDLDIGDQILPKGSSVAIGILPIHRNEKYWPNPLKFDPDRFLPEEVAKRHPYAFLAFSGGPRNCLGLSYAMMSMKTLTALVLRKYILKKDDILPVKDIRLKLGIMLHAVEPIKIRIERRTMKRT